jgi:hypothetical protein
MDWYGYSSVGFKPLADLLVRLGFFTYDNGCYTITVTGMAKLRELTAERGIPEYPQPESQNSH